MSKKKRKNKKGGDASEWEDLDWQDENFYFIAGFTSGGAPYGTTWQEAQAMGLLEEDRMDKTAEDLDDDEELPF